MAAQYKRKTSNFFIKKDFQGKMALAIFLSVIGGCLLFLLLMAVFSADSMMISYTNSDVQVGRTPWMLFKNTLAANWIFLIIGSTFLVLAAVVGTHRIAGPLYHFEKTFSMMIEGNLSDTIYLREKDEGKDLAARVNQFNAMLSKKLQEVDRNSEAINNLLAQYESLDIAKTKPEEAESICKAIKKHNDKNRFMISYFTLADD